MCPGIIIDPLIVLRNTYTLDFIQILLPYTLEIYLTVMYCDLLSSHLISSRIFLYTLLFAGYIYI